MLWVQQAGLLIPMPVHTTCLGDAASYLQHCSEKNVASISSHAPKQHAKVPQDVQSATLAAAKAPQPALMIAAKTVICLVPMPFNLCDGA